MNQRIRKHHIDVEWNFIDGEYFFSLWIGHFEIQINFWR